MKRAKVLLYRDWAGTLTEDENGYHFQYRSDYLAGSNPEPVSLTLPLRELPYSSPTFFPFFDGLIPEGWLLDIAEKTWKLDHRDRMGLLMVTGKDCIGAVSVVPTENEENL